MNIARHSPTAAAACCERMGAGVAVLPTAPEQLRNRDTHYPYRADSYFHYLTGFTEPEAVLVLLAGAEPQVHPVLPRQGPREGNLGRLPPRPGRRAGAFGFDAAHSIGELDAKLPELMADQPALWYSLGHDAAWDARIAAALNAVRAQAAAASARPPTIHDVRAGSTRCA